MIELNLENKKGKIKINSNDVKNVLELRLILSIYKISQRQ